MHLDLCPRRAAGVALLTLSVACAPSVVHEQGVATTASSSEPQRARVLASTIHGDVRFNREERLLVESAAEAWHYFTQGRVRFAVVWDWSSDTYMALAKKPHMIRVPAREDKVELLDAREGGRTRGYVREAEIGIVAERCDELYPVVMHELGHFAGLEHVRLGGSVMHRTSPGGRFTEADGEECVRVGLCDTEDDRGLHELGAKVRAVVIRGTAGR
jgi:hypothetical protein